MDWTISDGDNVLLFNVNSNLFIGKPMMDWSTSRNTQNLMLPVVTDSADSQIVTIRKINNDKSQITTNSIFKFEVLHNNKRLYFHTLPFSSSELSTDPPIRLTLSDSKNSEWKFSPALPDQIKNGDKILHYGMPVYILKNNGSII